MGLSFTYSMYQYQYQLPVHIGKYYNIFPNFINM